MNMLMDIGGVDLLDHPSDPEWRYEIAYQLLSLEHQHRYRIKVALEDAGTSVPTLFHHWRMANWMEREVYDQFGIRFDGHQNLRRILNHEDFEGHPLRKDYPLRGRGGLGQLLGIRAF